jgi:hypothetical protein
MLQLVVGTSKVVVERDSQNSHADELPCVLAVDLCSVASREFTSSLHHQKLRLKLKFSDDQIEKIDQQFQDLRIAFREQDGLKESIEEAQSQSTASSYQNCWSPLESKIH